MSLITKWKDTPNVVQVTGNVYYLDTANGNDSNDGERLNKAWKTLAHARSAAEEGDTILVAAGNYGEFAEVAVDRSMYIRYKAVSGAEPVFTNISISGTPSLTDSFLVFDGFTVNSGVSIPNSKHLKFRNCEVTVDGDYAISGVGSDYVTVENCTLNQNSESLNEYGRYWVSRNNTINSTSLTEGDITAVWAYPDSNIVTGTVNIGIVTYDKTGIKRVKFTVNSVQTTVNSEAINSATGEYEWYFALNTTGLTDGTYTVSARVETDTYYRNLTDITLFVANNISYTNRYIAPTGSDTTGTGTSGNPWATLGKALTSCTSGDTILCATGTYAMPTGSYSHTRYVTIKPNTSQTVEVSTGTLQTPFLKFEDIIIGAGGLYAGNGAHHIWCKGCTYEGYGNIWSNTTDRGFSFNEYTHNIIIENCTSSGGDHASYYIGSTNYICRNNEFYEVNGDGTKWMNNNVLITGNHIHDNKPPTAWSQAKNNPNYDFSTNNTLNFYTSTDYGSNWTLAFTITLTGGAVTTAEVVSQLNSNGTFAATFTAESASSPYPYPGNLRIYKTSWSESFQFYVTGNAVAVLDLSDCTRTLNDISETYPAESNTEHCDYIANDAANSENVVVRNNKMYAGHTQGIKLDLIGGTGYKKNIAIINNLIVGGDGSSTMFYMNYRGSGAPASYISYENLLFVYNTIMRPSDGFIRAVLSVDMTNPNLTNIVFKNNIIGDYLHGDWNFVPGGGISDYNFWADDTQGSGTINTHSVKATTLKSINNFTNANYDTTWDFTLVAGSQARGIADPTLNIPYDLEFNSRSLTTPDAGCYEY